MCDKCARVGRTMSLSCVAVQPPPRCDAPTRLRCEYFTNPLAIDAPRPRLSWWVNDARRGAVQRAYHLQVASARDALAEDRTDLWDSGKVTSDQSCHVPYAG